MRSFLAFSLFFFFFSTHAQLGWWKDFNVTASLPTIWDIKVNYSSNSIYYGSQRFRPILIRETNGSAFGCGFHCDETNCTSFLFSIFIIHYNSYTYKFYEAVAVWSANRDYPVRDGAKLNFTAAGDLVLMDDDGSIVWTTNTTGKSVTGMNLTHTGNLVLFDVHNSVVWQSFDHPTDTLLLGQQLFKGQKLIPSVSETDWRAQQGLYSLRFATDGLRAYVGTNPPQLYYTLSLAIIPVTL